MKPVALAIIVLLTLTQCTSTSTPESRIAAVQETLRWDLDMSRSDLEEARRLAAAHASSADWMEPRAKELEAEIEDASQRIEALGSDSHVSVDLDQLEGQLAAIRDSASSLRTDADVQRR